MIASSTEWVSLPVNQNLPGREMTNFQESTSPIAMTYNSLDDDDDDDGRKLRFFNKWRRMVFMSVCGYECHLLGSKDTNRMSKLKKMAL